MGRTTIEYKEIFKTLVQKRHKNIDFEKVETSLGHLREGVALSYHDLEIIGNDEYWPFSRYWMWPAREQIERSLHLTKGIFRDLPYGQEASIKTLNSIFKNISLVSIILRFVNADYYAIYSRPLLVTLRVERGADDVLEYLNLLKAMDVLKKSFHVSRIADVDIIVWAIAHLKGEDLRTLKKKLAFNLPENLKPGEVIEFLTDDPLRVAEIYLKHGDHKTSGFWTANALEVFLNRECRWCLDHIASSDEDQIKYKIGALCKTPKYKGQYETLDLLRKLRNRAVHMNNFDAGRGLSKADARNFHERTKRLIEIGEKQ
jgi:hypothetical protein